MAKRKKTTRKLSAPLFAQRVAPSATVEAKRAPTHREPADEHAATELVLYIENTSDLSPDGPSGQGRSVLLNALRKWRKGTYDPEKAVRLFEYLAEAGAKRYAKEYGEEQTWSTMFNPATRHEAAKQLEASFRSSVENGEYDHVDTRIGVREGVEEHIGERSPANIRHEAERIVEGAGQAGGIDEVRRLAVRGWPENRPLDNDSPELRAAIRAAAQRELGRGTHDVRAGRKHSMSYGELPTFEQFEEDIRRPDPNNNDHPYWPEFTRFPMELVSAREIELAERYGLPEFRAERHRTGRNTRVRGFNADEREMYGFLEYLVEQMNDGDDEAGNLASSIMGTLGYEWI